MLPVIMWIMDVSFMVWGLSRLNNESQNVSVPNHRVRHNLSLNSQPLRLDIFDRIVNGCA
ncbi:hypothetical protein VIBNISFn27_560057 [Vibrio nigripulchritudo SFn27]|nr:hypothetical protein VIBNIBLFn1_930057 [Vibrio nigripulchritudo BLFn1]CCN89122.1 hypothetical protein VIBNISFn27_560057 [Vibrio nigripulchritudo SFn27]CCO41756.1 hypothetical protein VIBNISFn135_610030 [Vibrio nigripulchritudo SFn135]CCO50926.1 hypothetical protein VIBNIWn13_1050056 [Vibrio nigripulchritudo Wn13]